MWKFSWKPCAWPGTSSSAHLLRRAKIPDGIETKQVEHRLEGEDLVCPQCGDTMTEIGKEVVRTLEIIPAQMVVKEDIYYSKGSFRQCGYVQPDSDSH